MDETAAVMRDLLGREPQRLLTVESVREALQSGVRHVIVNDMVIVRIENDTVHFVREGAHTMPLAELTSLFAAGAFGLA